MSVDPASLEIRRSPLGPYRVRGRSASRLEAFSDAVFGFSATLLVVSLEVPHSYAELAESLKGFPAFGLSFLALVFIWLAHRGFFRRYGLNDWAVTLLNMILLFVVLFFVYPLKFLSITFVELLFGLEPVTPSGELVSRFTEERQVGELFLIYGLGFAAVFLCIALLYRRALARRDALRLDAVEVFDARSIFWHYMIMVMMAGLSVGLTVSGLGQHWGGVAGWIYGLLGPIMTLFWILRSRRRRSVEMALGD